MYSTPNKNDNINEKNSTYTSNSTHSAACDATRKVADTIHLAGEKVSNASHIAADKVRGNPLKASLMALGIGFVIGKLTNR